MPPHAPGRVRAVQTGQSTNRKSGHDALSTPTEAHCHSASSYQYGMRNLNDLEWAMRKRLQKPYGVEVEVMNTDALNTAEDLVPIFRGTGVLITSQGCRRMGMIWMHCFLHVDKVVIRFLCWCFESRKLCICFSAILARVL